MNTFKSNSVRGASTPAAINAGVSLKNVLDTANWSSAGTFQTFYRKEIECSEFAEKVLNSK